MTLDAKDRLRKRFFTARKDLGAPERLRQSEQVNASLLEWYWGLDPAKRSARKVAMTIQFGTEPDTDPVMYALYENGVDIWVPISHADRSMSWVQWSPDVVTEQSSLGPIAEPVGERFETDAVADADLIVVPALAADSAGFRLGKGGGYYDRFLAQLADLVDVVPPLITPVFDHELFAAGDQVFPVDGHDLPVDAVVTARHGVQWV